MIKSLIHGDCLIEMDKLIGNGVTVDMILVDPPYGITQNKWDSVIPVIDMWKRINAIIRKDGTIAIFGSEPFMSSVIQSNLKAFKYDLIWHKPNGAGHLNAKRQPLRNHESIAIFCNGKPNYNPQKWLGKPYNRGWKNPQSACYGAVREHSTKSEDGLRYPNSIIFGITNAAKGKLHPTQKPVPLLEYLIKTYSNKNETVLDFCAGSMSTAIACENTGRGYIMIEKDSNYFEIGKQRILAMCEGM